MSNHNPVLIDGIAEEAISKGQFVKYEAGGWNQCDAQGESADGVAFSDAAIGGAVAVQVGGLVKYLVGAVGVADGVKLTTTAAGLGELAASGDVVRLKAIGAGAAGAYAMALWVDRETIA
jgi:hypothetical protein